MVHEGCVMAFILELEAGAYRIKRRLAAKTMEESFHAPRWPLAFSELPAASPAREFDPQPRAGVASPLFGCRHGDAQHLGRFLERKPDEVT